MAETIAAIATPNGSRYLQQLCKHWSHKFETEFTPASGRINFGAAALGLAATDETLTLTLMAGDPAPFDRMEGVVADHLKRFAFREDLAVDWVRAAA